jgi:hypothetical protein
LDTKTTKNPKDPKLICFGVIILELKTISCGTDGLVSGKSKDEIENTLAVQALQ